MGRQGQRHNRAGQANVRDHDGDDGLYARPRASQNHHGHNHRGEEDLRMRRQIGQASARHSRRVSGVAVQARTGRLSQAYTALLQSAQHSEQSEGERDRRERRAYHHRSGQRHVAHHLGQEPHDGRCVRRQGLLRSLHKIHEQNGQPQTHRSMEDEGARKEATRHYAQTARRRRSRQKGLAKEENRAHQRTQRVSIIIKLSIKAKQYKNQNCT